LGQALAVFQAFSLTKLRISKLLSQKLKFWESLYEMIFYAFLKNSNGSPFPHPVCLLLADDGKPDSLLVADSGVDFNTVTGEVMDIPGFVGGVPVVKDPGDFEFPLGGNEGGILENF
jgi:hypothetical protein